MISIELALRLRAAGLLWQPKEHDQFALPESHMDQQVFMISELVALIQLHQGEPVVAFHGTSEWALDHVMVTEVVWVPSETQLREELGRRIGAEAPLRLDRTSDGYRCTVALAADLRDFNASNAETAYGLALLEVLQAAQTA